MKHLTIFSMLLFVVLPMVISMDALVELEPEDWSEEDDELLRMIEAKHVVKDKERENENVKTLASRIIKTHLEESTSKDNMPIQLDLCAQVHCSAGKICKADGTTAKCICIPECPELNEPRRKVCTNFNQTWASDCAVHRQRCLCEEGSKNCLDKNAAHVHIDYYGECRELPECTDDEMKDFPRRMREWFVNIMLDLANRNELPQEYVVMTHEAETNLTKRWTNAAIWKFCDLDVEGDRSVSRHELFPLRAPLIALEHCISPFLENCDQNNDHRITLKEWGFCLGLQDGELTETCGKISKE